VELQGGWITHLTINSSMPAVNSSGISVEAVYNFRVDSVWIEGMTADGMINTNMLMDGDAAIELQVRGMTQVPVEVDN